MANSFSLFGQVRGFKAFLLIILASVIAGFSDPTFGFNEKSARVLLSMWLVFLVLNYGGAIIRAMAARRPKIGYKPKVTARPVYLIFLVLSIVFARITGLQPALVFGSVLALEYSVQLKPEHTKYAGRAAVWGAIYAAVLGLTSWVLYSILSLVPTEVLDLAPNVDTSMQAIPDDQLGIAGMIQYALVALGEFLAMLAIAALASLPISLLPFKFLEGIHLWRWSKVRWAITYGFGSTVYTLVLMTLPQSWSDVSVPVIWWAAIYVGYFVIAGGIWAYLRFTGEPAVKTTSGKP